ncbi:MAG: class I poly(R)-hydroxyalkanoic acid synthase [Pseudomonadota bacterium]
MQASTKNDEMETPLPYDPIKFSRIMMNVADRAQPIIQEVINQYAEMKPEDMDPLNIQETYIDFLNSWAQRPEKLAQMQMEYWSKWSELWQESALKFLGEPSETIYKPEKGDRRFKSELWDENVYFDFLKQSYLMTSKWMHDMVHSTEDMSVEDLERLDFYTRQFADALAPTNFIMTNPDVLKETIDSNGENLIRGLENLLEDIKRGGGKLKISMTDYDAFELGKNIAVTPGQVIYQNDLIQLIQYEPTTDKVFKRPLLIVPPWINKYYILDLKAENSLIKWLVDQGHTVFCISWVNPGPDLADKDFADYIDDGILASLTEIEKITGEPDVNTIAYCIGGTLMTMALAYMKSQKQDNKIASVTYLTTLIDFEQSGELKMFSSNKTLEKITQDMQDKGLLEASHLQKTFSMLRANDLIWSFIINNYMMGREPFPFDLLYWNDDSTNMPATMHRNYLRDMYRDNKLVQKDALSVHDTPVDIETIETPAYFLSTRDDHIAPWIGTYKGAQHLSGPVTFTLAASGHIAGVVNPPAKNKYCFWTSDKLPESSDDWMAGAKEQAGSWWPHWQNWVKEFTGKKVDARRPKKGLEAAPGSYVKMQSK